MSNKLVYKLDNNKKIYTRKDLNHLGYERYAIDQMVKNGMLIKITGSVFENYNYDGPEIDYYYTSALIPDGVVGMMSAAVYYGLTTFNPDSIDIVVKKDKKIATLPKYPPINIYHFSKERYELGVVTIESEGNSFRIYDLEKTVVDIVYFRNRMGIFETKEILHNYLYKRERNLNKLIRYARQMHCEKILRTYLEVLI